MLKIDMKSFKKLISNVITYHDHEIYKQIIVKLYLSLLSFFISKRERELTL